MIEVLIEMKKYDRKKEVPQYAKNENCLHIGPATNDVEIMKQLIHNGMDAARINFSHGTYETHAETIAKLKQAREELNAPIPLILDTKEPNPRENLQGG